MASHNNSQEENFTSAVMNGKTKFKTFKSTFKQSGPRDKDSARTAQTTGVKQGLTPLGRPGQKLR